MSVPVVSVPVPRPAPSSVSPAPVHGAMTAVPTRTATATRSITVGLLGLGQVGQAVARLVAEATRIADSGGVRLRVAAALVRDVTRPRRCRKPARVTNNPSAFLRGHYDVVVEALGTVEPARTIVARLLGRGVPVVTANKALVAAHGPQLAALAARRGTSFRYEASALAGIPFLGALAARPLVSDVHRFTAVVNGTSNFILTTIERERCGFADALARAQALGLTEPDPSRDLDGLDAADKLVLLATLFGWGTAPTETLDVHGIREIGAADLDAARQLGATIKPLVWAARTAHGFDAYIGPTLVPLGHPLAALAGTLSGIQFSGQFVQDLFFSGPGAGPDITAATILDDVVEAVSTVRQFAPRSRRETRPATAGSPATGWLLRARFPGHVPDRAAVDAAVRSQGLHATEVSEAHDNVRWVRVAPTVRDHLDRATAALAQTHRIQVHAIRAL